MRIINNKISVATSDNNFFPIHKKHIENEDFKNIFRHVYKLASNEGWSVNYILTNKAQNNSSIEIKKFASKKNALTVGLDLDFNSGSKFYGYIVWYIDSQSTEYQSPVIKLNNFSAVTTELKRAFKKLAKE